jgi:hypothetical protein
MTASVVWRVAGDTVTARLRPVLRGIAARWAAPSSPLKLATLALSLVGALALAHALPTTPAGSAAALYYQAAVDLRHGHSPYGAAIAWIGAHSATDWRNLYMDVYTYPPLLALLLIPLSGLSVSSVVTLWSLLSLACAIYLATSLARLVAPAARKLDRALAVAVALDAALLFGPLRHSMRGAQADIELIALAVGAWSALRSGRRVTSGLLLGLAIAVKPTYVLLLGFHLWRREWRAAGSALLVGAAGLAVPFLVVPHAALADYLRVTAFWNTPGFIMAPKSISIFGVVERALYLAPPLWRLFTAPWVARVIAAAIGLGVYVAASRLVPANMRRGEPQWDYAFGLAVMVMLLGSPLTEDAHLALALIPLAIVAAPLVARVRRGEARAWLPLALGGLFFLYVTLPVRGIASFSTYDGWRALLAGYWFYGLAGLAALYVWAGRRAPYRGSDPSVLTAAWGWLVSLWLAWRRTSLRIVPSRRWQLLVTVVCLGLVAYLSYRQIRAQMPMKEAIDFFSYYKAALALRHGANPYTPGVITIGRYVPGGPLPAGVYVYAPIFAMLLIPLTFLPLQAALALWDACLLAFLFVAIVMVARAVGVRWPLPGVVFLGTAAAFLSPIRDELYMGQADLVLLCLVCVACWALMQRRTASGGLALAAACIIKPPLLLLVAFLVWKREGKTALVAGAAYLGLLLAPFLWLGGQALHDMFALWGFWSNQMVSFENNVAPKAVLARLFTVNSFVTPLVMAPWLMTAIWLIIVAAILLLMMAVMPRRPLRRDARSLLEIGIVITAMLLISPLTEYIHLTVLVLPLLILLAVARQGEGAPQLRRRALRGGAIIWLLLCLPLQHVTWSLTGYVRYHPVSSPVVTILYAVCASIYLPALVGLFMLQIHALHLIAGRSAGAAMRGFVDEITETVLNVVKGAGAQRMITRQLRIGR